MPLIAPLMAEDPRQVGPFALSGRLGAGGQGTVYLGATADGERAAVKVLHVNFAGDATARSRFAREARAAARVASFCTARVIAADLAGDTPYIASEYIDGRSLREVVETDGVLRGADLDRLAIGTATALTAIHQAGIVHRDLKPDNVLLAADGPRVVDFGIARILDSTGTITSRAVGTPAYMAPEQVSGGDIGPHTDVFAWGSTIAFAATGVAVFAGGSMAAVLNRILNTEPDLGPLPAPLRALVADCLRKAAADRPGAEQILLRLLGHPEEGPVGTSLLAQGVRVAGPEGTRPIPLAAIREARTRGRAPDPSEKRAAPPWPPAGETPHRPAPHRPALAPDASEQRAAGPWPPAGETAHRPARDRPAPHTPAAGAATVVPARAPALASHQADTQASHRAGSRAGSRSATRLPRGMRRAGRSVGRPVAVALAALAFVLLAGLGVVVYAQLR
jgi:predicted Ser/Thr protein kinase